MKPGLLELSIVRQSFIIFCGGGVSEAQLFVCTLRELRAREYKVSRCFQKRTTVACRFQILKG